MCCCGYLRRVAYFPDGTSYSYLGDEPGTVNIAWLDGHHPFPTGTPSKAFLAALARACRQGSSEHEGGIGVSSVPHQMAERCRIPRRRETAKVSSLSAMLRFGWPAQTASCLLRPK